MFDIADMIANHTAANCSSRCCTLMSVTARKDQAQSYGCIVADESDKVMHYVEKVRICGSFEKE